MVEADSGLAMGPSITTELADEALKMVLRSAGVSWIAKFVNCQDYT